MPRKNTKKIRKNTNRRKTKKSKKNSKKKTVRKNKKSMKKKSKKSKKKRSTRKVKGGQQTIPSGTWKRNRNTTGVKPKFLDKNNPNFGEGYLKELKRKKAEREKKAKEKLNLQFINKSNNNGTTAPTAG